jgi:run domain Beclin-1 interacting cysteine-rich containing protein
LTAGNLFPALLSSCFLTCIYSNPFPKFSCQAENFELIEFYDEIVNEMEEILLDSGESPGARFLQGNHLFQSQLLLPLRDGGSTASTSGTNKAYPLITHPKRIDRVEVVGAKQKKGDVSLSERLVGVKEYTMYIIRVWSGKDQWEVERRYRDFHTLYRRLKSLFADQGWTLPSPWSSVEKESRKIFGNASPDVVSERSVLIKECLHSTIHSGFFSSPPSALVWFLCPQGSFPSSPAARMPVARSIFSNKGADAGNISTLGKTISLIVEIQPHKSTKQMLEVQHYTCAGCHKHFDDGMTLMQDFVQTLGWGKPRLCEYTGQLFCSSCHTNETAVLPARVLHYWDFNQYPVSHLAKSYLDSIHEQVF